jgi:hypothetical protein
MKTTAATQIISPLTATRRQVLTWMAITAGITAAPYALSNKATKLKKLDRNKAASVTRASPFVLSL